MIAFAGNSILVRLALSSESIGPLSFSILRLLSGAVVLALLTGPKQTIRSGNWTAALFLLTYIFFFSYAYRSLEAGTGALILFATVQIVMIGSGIRDGERLKIRQWLGTSAACVGLVFLLLPGASTSPDPIGSLLMGLSGLGWAMYSLVGRKVTTPILATAGNFLKAFLIILVIGIPLLWIWLPEPFPQASGIGWAFLSGGVTSGLGYSLWYHVLRQLPATRAAIAQLSVPAIAAIGGLLFLSETLTMRLFLTTIMVLGGVGVATFRQK